ncbi:hypothetical protein C8Q80DRAFT_231774 [Daedaleopsis nitida]|nr:hypothetical protein C8Q80DRAFT_231774 [Daedaleopsis nitida]
MSAHAGDIDGPPVSRSVLLLIGPIYFAVAGSCLLFGISIVQLYIYCSYYPNDRQRIKGLVYWVFALDVYLTVVSISLGWHVLCSGWGREVNIQAPGWSFPGIVAGDGIMATTVHIFYAWRIWMLKKWIWVPGTIILISLAQLGSAISIAAGISHIQHLSELLPFFPRTTVWLGGAATADILIAVAMLYILLQARHNARAFRIRRSQRTINRLMALSLETGSITAACALIELVFFLAPGVNDTNIHAMLAYILGKIYSNAMMANLNSRVRISERNTEVSRGISTSLSFGGVMNTYSEEGTRRHDCVSLAVPQVQQPPLVHITSEMENFEDMDYGDSKQMDSAHETIELADIKKSSCTK